jgi:hypothetical protein
MVLARRAASPSHGRNSRATYTPAATGRFGNITRTGGIGGTRTATGFVPKGMTAQG